MIYTYCRSIIQGNKPPKGLPISIDGPRKHNTFSESTLSRQTRSCGVSNVETIQVQNEKKCIWDVDWVHRWAVLWEMLRDGRDSQVTAGNLKYCIISCKFDVMSLGEEMAVVWWRNEIQICLDQQARGDGWIEVAWYQQSVFATSEWNQLIVQG